MTSLVISGDIDIDVQEANLRDQLRVTLVVTNYGLDVQERPRWSLTMNDQLVVVDYDLGGQPRTTKLVVVDYDLGGQPRTASVVVDYDLGGQWRTTSRWLLIMTSVVIDCDLGGQPRTTSVVVDCDLGGQF